MVGENDNVHGMFFVDLIFLFSHFLLIFFFFLSFFFRDVESCSLLEEEKSGKK